jgi:hypothetical protein
VVALWIGWGRILKYINDGKMDVQSCWEHGCTYMSGIWMYIHVGNMDVHSCRKHGCTFMSGTWMYIHVGKMDVQHGRLSCRYVMGNIDDVPDLMDLSSSSDEEDEEENQYEEIGSYLYADSAVGNVLSALGNVTSSTFLQVWMHEDSEEIFSNFSHPWLWGDRFRVEDIEDILAQCATALTWRQVNEEIRRR